jgi:hypothetical protein
MVRTRSDNAERPANRIRRTARRIHNEPETIPYRNIHAVSMRHDAGDNTDGTCFTGRLGPDVDRHSDCEDGE